MDFKSLLGESNRKEQLFITEGVCGSSLFSCSWWICSTLCSRTIELLWRSGSVFIFKPHFLLWFPPDSQASQNNTNKQKTPKSPPMQQKRKREANVTLKHYCKNKESIIPCHGYSLEWHTNMNYLFEFLTEENRK